MGLRIKDVIIEHDLTFKEVASRMGISASALQQAVNGRKSKAGFIEPNPTYKLLQSIANAIPCHITELFDQPKLDFDEEKIRAQRKMLQDDLYWIQKDFERIQNGINRIYGVFGFDNYVPEK